MMITQDVAITSTLPEKEGTKYQEHLQAALKLPAGEYVRVTFETRAQALRCQRSVWNSIQRHHYKVRVSIRGKAVFIGRKA